MPTEETETLWRDLHRLLIETQVMEGKLVCGNCGHEYRIKEGIANFLLPGHLV
jgi:multifunctional methyltransferase subunit TRM112